MVKQWIVGKRQPTERQLFMWNMIGSMIYSLASMILTYMTIRIVGEKEGGIFAIALTLAQMFIYIAYYEMRNYEVTDTERKYLFEDYHAVKILNCVLMLLITGIYCMTKQYDAYKSLTVMLVGFYRMLDGYADVYEAEFHAHGRLDLAGKSMAFRTVLSVGVYFLVLIVTRQLLFALLAAIISGVVGIWVFDIWIFDCVAACGLRIKGNKMIGIWKDCFPMFLGMFLWTYLLSASRIAVDDVMASEYQSYYQVLFLPVSVINLLAGFLIRPSLIRLTQMHVDGNRKAFWKDILRMFFILVGFTLVCMAGAYVCGIPILNILVGCDLSEYRLLFVFLIFAGGFNAVSCLLYYVLTIFRSGNSILLGYIVASVVAYIISPMLVRWKGLWGAGISYLVPIILLIIIFLICIIYLETTKKGDEYSGTF